VGDALGGFIFPRFQPAFDGMAATLKILEMMASQGVRLHQLIRSVPERFLLRDQIPCPWESKGAVMRTLIEETKGENVELIDGIKVLFGKEWVLLYPDQDKPYFHIVVEGEAQPDAEALLHRFREKVKGWL
jgi:mannose-1-phosphate guanylyltransferase/phosphomannomutase